MMHSGEYGGRVIRGFKGEVPFIAGAIISPDVAMKWPLANRLALHKNGCIDWFGPPAEEEQIARVAGKPAPTRGKVAEPKETAPAAKPAASRRTRTAA